MHNSLYNLKQYNKYDVYFLHSTEKYIKAVVIIDKFKIVRYVLTSTAD